jgi:hypothetical protein
MKVEPDTLEVTGEPLREKMQVLTLLAIVVILGIVIGVVLGIKYGSAHPAPDSSPEPVSPIQLVDKFRSSLSNETNAAIDTNSTPQSQALQWLTSEEHPPFIEHGHDQALMRMTQQFALVTLYHATNGDSSWTDNTGWLNYSVNECDWLGCNCTEEDKINSLDLWVVTGSLVQFHLR